MSTQAVLRELQSMADPEKAAFLQKFFRAIPGGYGEGDLFLGVTVPKQRKVAGRFANKLDAEAIQEIIESPYHEVRLTAVLMVVEKYKKSTQKDIWVEFYLKNLQFVNNWDLVDSSAHLILGDWLLHKDRTLLFDFAKNGTLWEQRVAIISTLGFIRRLDFDDTLKISEILLRHPHDLIQKAVGWMLREVGKRDIEVERAFLIRHYKQMPRTMLRYSIERFPKEEREFFMKKD